MRRNIAFFQPSYGLIGGIQIVFASLADALSNTCNVYIIDVKNDIYRSLLKHPSRCNFLEFDYKSKVVLPENTTIVLPLSFANQLGSFEGKYIKLLFWSLYEKSLSHIVLYKIMHILPRDWIKPTIENERKLMKLLNYKLYKRLQRFLCMTNEKNGLVFMSSDHVYYNEQYFDIKLKPNYLPICIKTSDEIKVPRTIKEEINVAWLGRIVDFKFPAIEYLLSNLDEYCIINPSKKINLFIIGDGNYRKKLEIEISKYTRFNIKLLGSLLPNEVKDIFLSKIDILFAHGTAALDGAKVGLSTAVISGSFTKISKDKKLYWLYEPKMEHFVGSLIDDQHDCCVHSFSEILDMLITNNKEIGEKCYQRVVQNFDVLKVSASLLNYINYAKLTLEDIKSLGLRKSTIFQKLLHFVKEKFLYPEKV
ncbi:MAG: hypothetical protein LBD69_04625 [Puniceicoccales bacterium]|jgi:glycosyltransferase involved in cell wall biosynthesis|nr:hypothetical protein [Puniceicoccales bacterium]